MRGIRAISLGALMFAALLGGSAGTAYAVSSVNLKGEGTFTQATKDAPLDSATDYIVSYNSSGGPGKKASGGFTLSETDGTFVIGGKTISFCQYDNGTTRIINSVNPPKKNGVQEAAYLTITLNQSNVVTAVDAVQDPASTPSC